MGMYLLSLPFTTISNGVLRVKNSLSPWVTLSCATGRKTTSDDSYCRLQAAGDTPNQRLNALLKLADSRYPIISPTSATVSRASLSSLHAYSLRSVSRISLYEIFSALSRRIRVLEVR